MKEMEDMPTPDSGGSKKKAPKANKKLKNIQAVNEMLQGTHKSQTKKTFSFYDAETVRKKREEAIKKRDIGERWVDSNGDEWEQKDGYRLKNPSRGDMMMEYQNFKNRNCLKKARGEACTCSIYSSKRLDSKMFVSHGMCMDCVSEMETKLKIQGKYEEYEKNRMKSNVEAFLKEAETEKNELKKMMVTDIDFVNSDGSREKWNAPGGGAEIGVKLDEDFEKLRQKLMNDIDGDNDGRGNKENTE